MNAYSQHLREKIVQALRRGATKSEAARAFGVSRSSVKRYAKLAEEGRSLAPKRRPGLKPKLDIAAKKLLEAMWKNAPVPPSPSGASTSGGWPGCRLASPPSAAC
jgi:transposase